VFCSYVDLWQSLWVASIIVWVCFGVPSRECHSLN
jgi:hypothetical protein